MPLLANHIAVVTGAGSGIGRAIAHRLCPRGRAGRRSLDMNEKAAADVAKEIRDAGGKAESFALDVTKREDCIAVAKNVADKIGQVSILVNNAGIARRNGMLGAADAVIKDWEDIIAINLNGVFNVTYAFLEPLRGLEGTHRQYRLDPVVRASEDPELAGLHRLQARRARLHQGARRRARQGRRARQRHRPWLYRDAAERRRFAPTIRNWRRIFIDHTPLGRAGTAEDIVGPAIFLASDMSAYVSGSIVMVDGAYRTV